ncbi:hypothetical protein BXO87_02300 [Bacillus sp. GZB]|uniref:hypothetical protein n=1 Tax=Bacillus TaxID=1386 RepID=UPI000978B7B4|nr:MULTISPECIES: hypothetical protein [Bacillus]MCZ4246954.1 hypothetical protein [Bacillus amyloliquefaciens]OMQ06857.1 hypothetical protein BXO87_02300 [Bacillus sp. GZB]
MKVADILLELEELEKKRNDIESVLSDATTEEKELGEAEIVLQQGLEKTNKKLTTFLNSEFAPAATLLYLTVTPSTLAMNAEDTAPLSVIATYSDGTTKDVTSPRKPVMFFRDFNELADNKGFITSIDITGYLGEDKTFEIVKTSGGFDIDDSSDTQGLQVISTSNSNEYTVVDLVGSPIGITFTTNGEEAVGDNWLVDIYLVGTGTTYEVDDISLASVNESGVVTALGGGEVNITVRNGQQLVDVPLTIVDTIPPEPPSIKTITPLAGGAEILFDPSTSTDVVSYNIYVDSVQKVTGVLYDGNAVSIELVPADGETTYLVSLSAVDGSGNESEQSPAVEVAPLSAETTE